MKLKIIRDAITDKSTGGMLYINDKFECYTMEDITRPAGIKVRGETCIPAGNYKVSLDISPRYKRIMPHILDVPMFDGIRIHSGNTPDDSEGCILVGNIRRINFVGESRLAYANLFAKMKHASDAGEQINLEIEYENMDA